MPTPTVRSLQFDLAQSRMRGNLGRWLQGRRTRNVSYDRIAVQLYESHDIAVTGPTIKAWCERLGVVDPNPNGG